MVSRYLLMYPNRFLHLNYTIGPSASPALQLHWQPTPMRRRLSSKIVLQKHPCAIDVTVLLLIFLCLASQASIFCITMKNFRALSHINKDNIQHLELWKLLMFSKSECTNFSSIHALPFRS